MTSGCRRSVETTSEIMYSNGKTEIAPNDARRDESRLLPRSNAEEAGL